jgi:hypothetical protein
MEAKNAFDLTNPQPARVIQIQQSRGRTAHGGEPFDLIIIEAEMFMPSLAQGMEERHIFAGHRIDRPASRAFVQVATRARENKVVVGGTSALALRNHMFDMKRGSLQALVHAAVLTPPAGSRVNGASECLWHGHYGCLPRTFKASPRTSDSCSLNSTKASNSALSDSCNRPSLLRSINS